MQPRPSEITSTLHYLLHSNPAPMQFARFPNNPGYNFQIPSQLQDMNPQCFSGNSTSDEAEEQQLSLINERKQRRMISNRESARRSRMRKQKHLDELWSQVVWLRNENHQLIDKLNQVSERCDQVVQENTQLKDEASDLRQMITELQTNNNNNSTNYLMSLRDFEDVSNPSTSSTSMDLLG